MTQDSDQTTRRRRFLQLTGSAAILGIAGCSGNGSSGDPGTNTSTETRTRTRTRTATETRTETPTETETDTPTETETRTPTPNKPPARDPWTVIDERLENQLTQQDEDRLDQYMEERGQERIEEYGTEQPHQLLGAIGEDLHFIPDHKGAAAHHYLTQQLKQNTDLNQETLINPDIVVGSGGHTMDTGTIFVPQRENQVATVSGIDYAGNAQESADSDDRNARNQYIFGQEEVTSTFEEGIKNSWIPEETQLAHPLDFVGTVNQIKEHAEVSIDSPEDLRLFNQENDVLPALYTTGDENIQVLYSEEAAEMIPSDFRPDENGEIPIRSYDLRLDATSAVDQVMRSEDLNTVKVDYNPEEEQYQATPEQLTEEEKVEMFANPYQEVL